MIDSESRYADVPRKTLTLPNGREVAYLGRRFCPQGAAMTTLVEVSVLESDRLDLIAARVLGDPLAFWQIADANDAVDTFELERPGARLRVAVPEVGGDTP